MEDKFSVVIPCYNMGHYIEGAVNSVRALRSMYDIEVIIIDDGSDDKTTPAVLKTFDDKCIKVVHQENQGLSYARNQGIALAESEFIILLDADNTLNEGYFKHGISHLKNDETIGLVYGNVQFFGGADHYHKPGQFNSVNLLRKNYIDACVLLRKSAWKSIHGYDEKMILGFEDWDLNIRLFFKGWQLKYIDHLCFHYRVKEVSMLTEANKKRDEIIDVMFSKPELRQAGKLREVIVKHDKASAELKSIAHRKVTKFALRLERWLKQIKP